MWKEVIFFIISTILLIKSSQCAVRSASHIAQFFRLTEFATSFILIAFLGALPDAFISITAAIRGDSSLGAGTLLGGNFADLTLILGLISLAGHPLLIHSRIVKNDLYFAGLALLPLALGVDGLLSRFDALILIVCGICYFTILYKENRYFHKPFYAQNNMRKHLLVLIIALAIMLISTQFIVSTAENIAISLSVPTMIIGLLALGLGTTLPEFTFSLQSIRRGHAELAIGDILGNVAIDSTLLMGIVALIQPIPIELSLWAITATFLTIGVTFALIFMRTDSILSKNEALTLVFFYIAFVIAQLFIR